MMHVSGCLTTLHVCVQVFNLFMPRVNIRRQAQWYADGEPQDFSPSDSQVRHRRLLGPFVVPALATPAIPSPRVCAAGSR